MGKTAMKVCKKTLLTLKLNFFARKLKFNE